MLWCWTGLSICKLLGSNINTVAAKRSIARKCCRFEVDPEAARFHNNLDCLSFLSVSPFSRPQGGESFCLGPTSAKHRKWRRSAGGQSVSRLPQGWGLASCLTRHTQRPRHRKR